MSLGRVAYFEKYLKIMQKCCDPDKKGEDFYNELEEWHEKKYGARKYSNYISFRKAKTIYYQWEKSNRKR